MLRFKSKKMKEYDTGMPYKFVILNRQFVLYNRKTRYFQAYVNQRTQYHQKIWETKRP